MTGSEVTEAERRQGTIWGSLIGDAHAMPVHWYYDREALQRDYGRVTEYRTPKNPHAGSILWRSQYIPENAKADILHDQARFWGQRGVHYHQNLAAGENTLNLKLGLELLESLNKHGGYDGEDYLNRYVQFMLEPGRHRDTYVEECHRNFFTRYARDVRLERCGQPDVHIGGLAHVGILTAGLATTSLEDTRAIVQRHVSWTHPDDGVLKAADTLCRILHDALHGQDLRAAIIKHGNAFFSEKRSKQWRDLPDGNVIERHFSTACYIDGAFPASLFLAWKYAGDFREGIIANTNVGGDNCHRGAVIGALLGAAVGTGSIPETWITGLVNHATVTEQLQAMPQLHPATPLISSAASA